MPCARVQVSIRPDSWRAVIYNTQTYVFVLLKVNAVWIEVGTNQA